MSNYKNHLEKIERIKSGELSLVENIASFFERIEKNKDINAYNFIFKDDAIEKAKKIESKIKSGVYGKLAGMAVAIKDVLAIKGKPLTCSSKILKDFISIYDSTAVKRILDEDGIILGKTNCDEFAMGSSNENSYFGPVLNPVDKTRAPGGSSGGSAAAVAANFCDVSLGTDTGGSIRQPASFCGIFGFKPTYGRVSRFGLTAFASSFDSIGPFSKNVEDAALMMETIAGVDSNDSTCSAKAIPPFAKEVFKLNKKFKIGLPKEYFHGALEQEIKTTILDLANKLASEEFELIDVSLPSTEYSIAAYYLLTTAEASSNLARFDGARYGYRSNNASSLEEMYINSRTEGFGAEVKRRIMLGTFALSAGYYDAYYSKAQKVRRKIKDDFDKAFQKVDFLLTPTAPTTAFKLGEKINDPLQMYLIDIFTTSANLAGIPGASIPVGYDSKGLPIGAQLLAQQFNELPILQTSYFIQENIISKKIQSNN